MSVYRSKNTTNMRSGLRQRTALQPIVAVLNEWKDKVVTIWGIESDAADREIIRKRFFAGLGKKYK